jgi:hypothetical protein
MLSVPVGQPATGVDAVKLYVVVAGGQTVGVSVLELVMFVVGDHTYVTGPYIAGSSN